MKRVKTHLFLLLTFILIFALTGCSSDGQTPSGNSSKGTNDGSITIIDLTVDTAEANPENIWRVSWPKGYYSAGANVNAFATAQMPTDDDINFLVDFVSKNQSTKETLPEDKYLCGIYLTYEIDKNGQKDTVLLSSIINNDYPADYDIFIDIINKICGGDKKYLCMNKNLQEVTPEYIAIRTGLTDDSVYSGTMQDVIDFFNLDMNTLNWMSVHSLSEKCHNFPCISILPFHCEAAYSTDADAEKYAQRLAKLLGVSADSVVKSKAPYEDIEFYEFPYEMFGTVRIYQTFNINSDNTDNRITGFNELFLKESSSGPYDELSGYKDFEFIYSSGNTFAIAVEFRYDDDFYENIKFLADAVRALTPDIESSPDSADTGTPDIENNTDTDLSSVSDSKSAEAAED